MLLPNMPKSSFYSEAFDPFDPLVSLKRQFSPNVMVAPYFNECKYSRLRDLVREECDAFYSLVMGRIDSAGKNYNQEVFARALFNTVNAPIPNDLGTIWRARLLRVVLQDAAKEELKTNTVEMTSKIGDVIIDEFAPLQSFTMLSDVLPALNREISRLDEELSVLSARSGHECGFGGLFAPPARTTLLELKL